MSRREIPLSLQARWFGLKILSRMIMATVIMNGRCLQRRFEFAFIEQVNGEAKDRMH
jgi:hypothetical protein